MTAPSLSSLVRLSRANPAPVEEERGRSVDAQAALARILATERAPASRRGVRWRRHKVMILAFAALLIIGGGAVAATDPLGIFRSPNPGSAIFGVDPNRHVTPPQVQQIDCPASGSHSLRCGPGLGGQRYELLDHVQSNGSQNLTRGRMQSALAQERRSGRLTAAGARRLAADIAALSDSDLAGLRALWRFGMMSTGPVIVGGRAVAPPPSVPALIVCQNAGTALSCRDLNGDDNAPIGSGIYQALPAPDWRPAAAQQPDPNWSLEVAILGHPPNQAQLRFMIDLVRYGTTSSGGGSPRRADR
jgi:hypothetical protein